MVLLLDRRSCHRQVRDLVRRGLLFHKKDKSWSEVLRSKFYQPQEAERPRLHAMSMLGSLFTLLSVAIRNDCRCGSSLQAEEGVRAAAQLRSRYAEIISDAESLAQAFRPLLEKYSGSR